VDTGLRGRASRTVGKLVTSLSRNPVRSSAGTGMAPASRGGPGARAGAPRPRPRTDRPRARRWGGTRAGSARGCSPAGRGACRRATPPRASTHHSPSCRSQTGSSWTGSSPSFTRSPGRIPARSASSGGSLSPQRTSGEFESRSRMKCTASASRSKRLSSVRECGRIGASSRICSSRARGGESSAGSRRRSLCHCSSCCLERGCSASLGALAERLDQHASAPLLVVPPARAPAAATSEVRALRWLGPVEQAMGDALVLALADALAEILCDPGGPLSPAGTPRLRALRDGLGQAQHSRSGSGVGGGSSRTASRPS